MKKITNFKIATLTLFFAAICPAFATKNIVNTGLQVRSALATSVSRVYLDIINTNGASAQTAIVYLPQCTAGIDYGYDASIFPESNIISLYSIVEDYHLIIQALPAFSNVNVVTMGYTAPTAGTYTIKINHTEGVFSSGQNIYIMDKADGSVINLSEGSYSFTTEAGEFNNRFQVQYTENALGTDFTPVQNAGVTVYQNAGDIGIKSGNGPITGITVFSLNGKTLYTKTGINDMETTISTIEAKKQLVIVQVYTAKSATSKKIVF